MNGNKEFFTFMLNETQVMICAENNYPNFDCLLKNVNLHGSHSLLIGSDQFSTAVYRSNMEIITHSVNHIQISELTSGDFIITSVEDGTDLVGNLYYSGSERVIIHERNIIPAFFDLKNKMAGEILQKFSNYRIRLAIVGEFSGNLSDSLKSFIRESNEGKQIGFVSSLDQAIQKLSA